MVEAIPIFWAIFLGNGALGCGVIDASTVGEKDVEPSVVVVVKERNAGAHGLKEIFLRRVRGLTGECDVTSGRDIDKITWRSGCLWHSGRAIRFCICWEWSLSNGEAARCHPRKAEQATHDNVAKREVRDFVCHKQQIILENGQRFETSERGQA